MLIIKVLSPGPTVDTAGIGFESDEDYFYKSDGSTTLDSPGVISDSSSSQGSYMESYTSDPNCDGPAYHHSLLCGKHEA